MNELATTAGILAIANKLLGKTAEAISEDLARLYAAGRDKIITSALRKTRNINDGGKANLRVARDIFFNGSFTDESISAEYFGGVLASSRSIDGRDDRGIFYTDIIKSLSSQQLLFHYLIYRALNKLLLEMPPDKKRPDVAIFDDLQQYHVFFVTKELISLGLNGEKDLIAITSKGLLDDNCEAQPYKTENEIKMHYTKVTPSILGVQLYALAHNRFPDWRKFPIEDFGVFPDISEPRYFALSIEELMSKIDSK